MKTMNNYVYCDVCNKFCINRFYDNHLKSQTHINNLIKLQKETLFRL